MDNDTRIIDEAFSQLITEQQDLDEHYVNYASTDDSGEILNAPEFDPRKPASLTSSPLHVLSNDAEEIEMEVISHDSPRKEPSVVKRRKTIGSHEQAANIEDILEDLPSRTVGRKKGARIGRHKSLVDIHSTAFQRARLASIHVDQLDADDLFNEMYEDGTLDEYLLRDLPINMTLKRQVRTKAIENELGHGISHFSWYALWKFKMSLRWKHFKDRSFKFFATRGKLWQQDLKMIEGDFGTGVLSYFMFLRGIFLLSCVSFLLSFLFITVPQIFERPLSTPCNFTGEAILTGGNCLTNTLMYQGYYTNGTINVVGGAYYSMPFAYLFTTAGFFLLCLVWLVRATGRLFRQNYIVSQEQNSLFINKVFCAWDFGIMSQSTAIIQHKTISMDLKESLAEQRREIFHRTVCQKLELFMLRVLSWSFYLGIVAASIALIYFINKTFICEIVSQTGNSPIFQDLALPLIVSAINIVMPFIIDWITSLEKYKYPRHRLYISVFRNFLFKMGLLGVICAFWTSNNVQRCDANRNGTTCWETSLGQEIYRLVLVDFIFTLLFSTFCAEFVAKLIAKHQGKQAPEFLIANNVMDLVYGQTLCWIGVYFSPLLAFVNVLKFCVLFYCKRVSVMNNCRPSNKRWRAAQSRTLFNFVQLGSFLLSSAFLTYVIFNERPSANCGPFRGNTRAYDIVIAKVNQLAATSSGQWLATILRILTNVWVLDAVVVFLLILVLIKRNQTAGLEDIAASIQEQISLEGKDKLALLKILQRECKQNEKEHKLTQQSADSPMADFVKSNHSMDDIEEDFSY